MTAKSLEENLPQQLSLTSNPYVVHDLGQRRTFSAYYTYKRAPKSVTVLCGTGADLGF